ncbi:WD40 repeat-containing protein [Tieghemostelium lacteum]|uniref:WD40 repeat-containing protein n=1 Tax=Tieghemostelium lacteum TaxID=361077 RepID=A0A152A5T6_TIELA|nr:WD40 repeat-containing protein [Tieghemostelium lacteum]|eukprot:KYR01599.1 WD40 repeat-containing protein [Tieghemostelium lacteum]
MINQFPHANTLSKYYHFDSFPYENSYEEEDFQNKYTFSELQNIDKWINGNGLKPLCKSGDVFYPKHNNSVASNGSGSGRQLSSSSCIPLSSGTGSGGSSRKKKILSSFKNLVNLSNRFKSQNRETFISRLPCEILLYIVGYLTMSDVKSIMLVCQEWCQIGIEDILWKLVFKNHFIVFPNRDLPLSKSDYTQRLSTKDEVNNAPEEPHWKELFRDRWEKEMKWRNGTQKDSIMVGHTGTVWTIKTSGDKILTGSFDKTAKVWDKNTKKSQYTMIGHNYPVQCVDLSANEQILVTGSLDNSIRVWNLDQKKCQGILTNQAHNFDVFCLQFKDERYIISGSSDSTVKLWDLNPMISNDINRHSYSSTIGRNENNIEDRDQLMMDEGPHIDPDTIQFREDNQVDQNYLDNLQEQPPAILFDGMDDQDLLYNDSDDPFNDNINVNIISRKPQNPKTQINSEPLQTFKHASCVTCLQVEGNQLVSGGSDKVVRVWDLESGQERAILQGHKEGIRCLQFEGNVLVTGANDNTCKIWDLRINRSIATLRGHTGSIRCLQMNGSTLVTGSNDQTIKLWNLNHSSSTNYQSSSSSSKKPLLPYQDLFTLSSSISCLTFDQSNTIMYSTSDSKVKVTKFI